MLYQKINGRINRPLSQVRYWLQREKAKTKFSDDIEKEAFLLYLNDNIKYLSFGKTLSQHPKKCAFNYDVNNMELCPKCKKYSKGVPYPTCIKLFTRRQAKNSIRKN